MKAMDQESLQSLLAPLLTGPVRFYPSIGSTNDEAGRWAKAGAPDLALIVADAQTHGRGRSGRQWLTPPGSALAFSLVLCFDGSIDPAHLLPRLTTLGGLAVSDALINEYALPAEIKWPNDVLIRRKKVAGILAEAHWMGSELNAVILGIGVNVTEGSAPKDGLIYPATSVDEEAGRPVDRWELLLAIIRHLLARREALSGETLLRDWEDRLAFRGEWVRVTNRDQSQECQVLGVNPDGSLRLLTHEAQILNVLTGDVSLRPVV